MRLSMDDNFKIHQCVLLSSLHSPFWCFDPIHSERIFNATSTHDDSSEISWPKLANNKWFHTEIEWKMRRTMEETNVISFIFPTKLSLSFYVNILWKWKHKKEYSVNVIEWRMLGPANDEGSSRVDRRAAERISGKWFFRFNIFFLFFWKNFQQCFSFICCRCTLFHRLPSLCCVCDDST